MLGLGVVVWQSPWPPLLREHYCVLGQVCPEMRSFLNDIDRGRGKEAPLRLWRVARLSYATRDTRFQHQLCLAIPHHTHL